MVLENFLDVARFFKTDYEKCRKQFLAACDKVSYLPRESRCWPLTLEGLPELAVDAVFFGNSQAQRVLVMISGTHGVEGYCGSAVQSFLLHEINQQTHPLPDDVAILMIHSLNPWGMYWARRCDHQGIDLNRNFVDFSQLPAADPRQQQVLDALLQESRDARNQALMQLMVQWGQGEFERVVTEGQYDSPWAPFYGGRAPAFSAGVVDGIIEHWQLAQRELVVIDLHTGLGPWAYGELISDHPADSSGNRYATRLFGPAVANTLAGDSFSQPKHGLLDYRWHELMQEKGCYLTLEFGTYATSELFDVLCQDHLFWRTGTPQNLQDKHYLPVRESMLKHFCPRDLIWQQAVVFKAWQVMNRVVDFNS